jgi:hypothetical protein
MQVKIYTERYMWTDVFIAASEIIVRWGWEPFNLPPTTARTLFITNRKVVFYFMYMLLGLAG